MSDFLLEVNQVTKKMGKRNLLNNISFKLQKGKIYGFIGPNGAGKTTMMRIMTGLMKPTSGSVQIASYNVHTDREKALSKVGAIIESPVFFDYMTGRQVLRNLSRLHSEIASSDREAHIEELLTKVRLETRGDDKVKTYSLGMKQRLGIAQSMLGTPELLLLDEPSNGLDPMGMRELRDIVLGLRNSANYAFFISSHLLDELQQMCDELIVIKEGRLVWQGPTDQLIKEGQRLEDAFMGLMGL
ncbi:MULTISPECIES: ABC transporter ATP-binding protein [Paenibacillus]|uniref:ABC transporter ATP-binding protein n=1 Tax=Paenibacillus polymyxa (strain SC2) TaxID=886882 RepID=E3EBW9_PAEPS|nr:MULTISPECIES: ATP-binding cassette domain-containing protein [Paenibacillus]ADO59093.1 ABC transporter ATP-binding protein [Paenibacillus polymyxa SC2]AZH31678.1 ATP-binding cassette domain-containing protein [Paenibacillus sp. M-152]KAF6567690.1 ATP-binding cassette domain-containing protein [Paenibacillus sp. EKM202P]KAF6573195.1 ATP-binding cassette domain-containing protein [Paenibacillus sp. EKM207P]KAF6587111.1 ATP-binding cassette domain-containing protein [Paenibacillus sp. EKM211P]